ncbi:hypothetical protein KA005_84350, partial [bacterium]|nr:hypothetical protein [bacterium]
MFSPLGIMMAVLTFLVLISISFLLFQAAAGRRETHHAKEGYGKRDALFFRRHYFISVDFLNRRSFLATIGEFRPMD